MNTLASRISASSAALTLAFLLAASPRAHAQTNPTFGQNTTTGSQLTSANTANALGTTSATSTGSQQSSGRVTTGTICIQEMTATFCNVASGPNTNGYGSAGSVSRGASGSGSSSGSAAASASSGAGASTSSIPTCGGFPSANELCN